MKKISLFLLIGFFTLSSCKKEELKTESKDPLLRFYGCWSSGTKYTISINEKSIQSNVVYYSNSIECVESQEEKQEIQTFRNDTLFIEDDFSKYSINIESDTLNLNLLNEQGNSAKLVKYWRI